jgi:formamidopyrimidine-DNA glycosylase
MTATRVEITHAERVLFPDDGITRGDLVDYYAEVADVQGCRRELADTLPGRRVQRVQVRDLGVLRNTTSRALSRNLAKHTFATPRRHGKWLVLPTDGPVLLVHSGMTGHPYFASRGSDGIGYERLVIGLDRGELRYADLRKLGGIWLAADDDQAAEVMGKQGPDALDLDLASFQKALHGRRGALKPTLMDQSVIAGLGNLLVDEICWRARIHPGRPGAWTAAVADPRARRSRPELPTLWCAAATQPDRRAGVGVVSAPSTAVTHRDSASMIL